MFKRIVAICAMAFLAGCASTYQAKVMFPSPNDMFVTTGDGNIAKPYTPIGQLVYLKQGYRIPLPLVGMLPIDDVDPEQEIRRGILEEVKRMGGDGVIELKMNWTPASNGFLGLGADGGNILVYGTVIKR